VRAFRRNPTNLTVIQPDAESVEQQALMFVTFGDGKSLEPPTQRFSLGYNVGRRWR